jgi:hypothetical protein
MEPSATLAFTMSETNHLRHCQLGRKDEGQRALAQARYPAGTRTESESSDLGPYWTDWLIVHALVRESQELLERTLADRKNGSKTEP